MGREIRFSQDDALTFAAWSGDRNPLHVDPAAARRSVFGQPVIHGILTTIRAIASGVTDAKDSIATLDVEFRQSVHPGIDYVVETGPSDPKTLTVRAGNDAAAIFRIDRDLEMAPTGDENWVSAARQGRASLPGVRTEAACLEAPALLSPRALVAAYETGDIPREYLQGQVLTPVQVRVLALCSYIIGMEMPGLRSLFTRLRLAFSGQGTDSPDLLYRARIVRFDQQFRLLDVRLDVVTHEGAPVATADLRAYVRFTPVRIDPAATAGHLSADARRLAGQVALVVGGTRGLGAELTTALAAAGCQVYASYQTDRDAAVELTTALSEAGASIECLQGNASDRGWCEEAVSKIIARHQRLDLLVLNACAPPAPLRLDSGSADAFVRYIADNLRPAQVPLAVCLPALAASKGTVVGISSSFVAERPAGFGHYIALKEAVESSLHTAVRESNGAITAVIARPPRLQTAWNDTPTGVLGTIAARDAAIQIVNQAGREGRAAVEVVADFPPLHAAAVATRSEPETAPEFVLSLAASFTAEPLVAGLEFWFRELGIRGEVDVQPYGQILQTLLNPAAGV